ncbi:MAG: hypothetical protein WBP41_02210 [Saprospiraceae bacterium]
MIPDSKSYFVSPDPVTGSCDTEEFYTTDNMPLYTGNTSTTSNTLKIRPYSINNYSDYLNGVNVLDCYAIAAQVSSSSYFAGLSPTDDAPYRFISGDADYDADVDLDDAYMVQDLILGNRYDLTRNSWEWVLKDEIEEADERFEEDPYAFVIDYNWPGSEGIIVSASTNEIVADNDKFFGFRTTKIGDIKTDSGVNHNANSWVCGSGSYFTGGEIASRSNVNIPGKKVRAGSVITIAVNLATHDDIFGLELPIHYSMEDFSFMDISFSEEFAPKWNYNTYISSLVVLDFAIDKTPLPVHNGKILEFRLKALHDIKDIDGLITWNAERNAVIVGEDGNLSNYIVALEIKDILPPDLYIEIRSDGGVKEAYVESPKAQQVTLRMFNEQGLMVNNMNLTIQRGENHIVLENDLISGLYVIQLANDEQSLVTKMFVD